MVLHLHPGVLQPGGIHQGLVQQGIALRRDKHRRRKAAQVLHIQGRGIGGQGVLPVVKIVVKLLSLAVQGQEVAPLPVAQLRLAAVAQVERHAGVLQNLPVDSGPLPVPRHQAHRRGQIAAGRVSAHRDAPGVAAVLPRVLRCPHQGGIGILQPLGEAVLGSQTVLRRHHQHAAVVGQVTGEEIVHVQAVHGPAAAVVKHHHREGALPLGQIDAQRQLVLPGGHGQIHRGDIHNPPEGVGVLPQIRQPRNGLKIHLDAGLGGTLHVHGLGWVDDGVGRGLPVSGLQILPIMPVLFQFVKHLLSPPCSSA